MCVGARGLLGLALLLTISRAPQELTRPGGGLDEEREEAKGWRHWVGSLLTGRSPDAMIRDMQETVKSASEALADGVEGLEDFAASRS